MGLWVLTFVRMTVGGWGSSQLPPGAVIGGRIAAIRVCRHIGATYRRDEVGVAAPSPPVDGDVAGLFPLPVPP